MKKLSMALRRDGIGIIKLDAKRRDKLFNDWGAIYSLAKDKRGDNCTIIDNFDQNNPSIIYDDDARKRYEGLNKDQGFYLILDHGNRSAFIAETGPLPPWTLLEGINARNKDVCISSRDLSWTLCMYNEGCWYLFAETKNQSKTVL